MINLGNMNIADLRLGASQVKAAYFGSKQIWGGEEPVPTAEPLCFTAVQDNSTVRLAQYNNPPAVSLETSTDGETWADYTNNSTLTLASIGDKVYFRAKTENSSMASNWNKYNYFVMTGKIAASGNIQSLLKSDCSRTDVPTYGYGNLFYNCASLVTPPELPATTLNDRSYNAMFYKCSSLSVAPALPATTLYDLTYNGMFEDCTSLSAAPELPATTLDHGSYENLFRGCRNLTSIKVAFTAWPSELANNWVNGVAASGTFTCPAELPDTRGVNNIPVGWNVVHPASYPMQDLKLHFDAIDNGGVGNHLSSTNDWANIAPDTSADYKLRRTSGTWEDDSAVFTGAYDECFWLRNSSNVQIDNLFSSLNMLSSSWTYAIGLYYDPATIANYRGYYGQQDGVGGYGQIYLRTDIQVSWLLKGYKTDGQTGSQDSYFEGHAPNFKDYLSSYAFNTLVATWDASTTTFKVYINGQSIWSWLSPGGAIRLCHEHPLTLGGGVQSPGNNRVCKGKIYDFLVYSRALSDAEVAQLHNYQDARFNS